MKTTMSSTPYLTTNNRVQIVWTEDSPTRSQNYENRYGQHGVFQGRAVERWVYSDGTPVPGYAGSWSSCWYCDPWTGRPYPDPEDT